MKKTKFRKIYYESRANGTKTYYLRVRKKDGRQTWRAVGSKLEKAREILTILEARRLDKKFGIDHHEVRTFKSVSAEYLEKYFKIKSKERNWPRVESIIRILNGFFGKIDLREISVWTIDNFIKSRKNKGIGNNTVNTELSYLKAILNKSLEWEYLEAVPKIKSLPPSRRRARILSEEELDYVISKVSVDHRDSIRIAVGTGMRLGEIYRLRPENVDFRAGLIHLDDTKNLKPRSIPMTSTVKDIIRRRFEANAGRIFKDKHLATVISRFAYERKTLTPDVESWRFHDTRHVFISRLIWKGIDPYTVMELAGHSKLGMVTRYSHTDDEKKKAAIASLEIEPE